MDHLKVLIPTDFSMQGEFACLMVNKLEEKIPVEVHFLHVLDVPDTVSIDEQGEFLTCGEIDTRHLASLKAAAESKLATIKNTIGAKSQTHLTTGRITDAILKFSEAGNFDLIVMGTKGAWGIKETLSGSETQSVARRSKMPVLSLMCDRSDLKISNILLVNDFSHPVKEELRLLHKMVQAFDAKVHLLQIASGRLEEKSGAIEANMKKFAELNELGNYQCHVIDDKDVESGVVHFNQRHDMDLVCIGTHGKGGIFHHSIAEKLINHLFKPIISFHLSVKK